MLNQLDNFIFATPKLMNYHKVPTYNCELLGMESNFSGTDLDFWPCRRSTEGVVETWLS